MDYSKLFKIAKEKGVEDIQISINTTKKTEIRYAKTELEAYTVSSIKEASIKGIYNGKMGKYHTEVVDEKEFEQMVDKVIETAKYISDEDKVFIYDGKDNYQKIDNIYNKALEETPSTEKINMCKHIAGEILKKEHVVHSMAVYIEEERINEMVNSKGLNLKSQSNGFIIYAIAYVFKDNDTRNNAAGYFSNDFSSINPDKIIDEAYSDALKSIGAKTIKSGEYEAVLSEDAAGTLLACFKGIFSSEMNQKNMSILKDKVGEKIASDCLTIVDDPFLDNSMNRRSFDSDGVATSKKEIVENGVFKGFVYNLKTAYKENKKSTGNAIGSTCGLINPYYKPGLRTKDEMISSVKHGVYITALNGAHAGANQISCNFSLQVEGFLIEDGKLTQPIAVVTAADNYLSLLSKVVEVSSEIKNVTDCTALRVSSISISGE